MVLTKTLRIMQLTTVLLLAFCLQIYAGGKAQVITLQERDAPLEQIFKKIRKQTAFQFLYNDDLLGSAKKVSIDVTDAPIEKVLEICFSGQPLSYSIVDRTIVVERKPAKPTFYLPVFVVQGRITNEKGEPLEGVSITEKGKNTGTASNDNGIYSISVQGPTVLVFQMIGYAKQEIAVNNPTEINVVLKQSALQLSDVVVVGYGTQRKKDVTGSIASLSEAKIQSVPVVNPAMAIQGQVAGVQVMNNSHQPGGSVSLAIRGTNSINASNEPMYVVDGYPMLSGLPFISPSDIVSIEILKDASATAIYGSRAANGVVLIQTRKGKAGIPTTRIESRLKLNKPSKKIEMLNASEFRMLMNEAYTNQNAIDGGNRPLPYTQEQIDNPEYDIDWQDMAFRTGIGHNQNVSISGGNAKTIYAATLNYLDEQGIFETSDWSQISTRLNIESQVSKRIKLGVNISYNRIDNGQIETDNGNNSVPRAILESFPDRPVYDDSGNWMVADNDGYMNPIALLYGIHQKRITNKFIGSAFAELKITGNLTFRSVFNGDLQSAKYDRYIDKGVSSPGLPTQQNAVVSLANETTWISESYLTYNRKFNVHTLDFMLGASWLKAIGDGMGVNVTGFPTDAFLTNQLQSATTINSVTSYAEQGTQNSFFGRINYNLKDKYLFTATYRADGSSRFGKNNKYGSFPSGAFAWRLSEEPFMQSVKLFTNLKARVSYGITGNQTFANYMSLQRLGNTISFLGNRRVPGIANVQMANPALKWEKTQQFDAGIDFSILNDRLSFVIDYYSKRTRDLLLSSPIPSTNGFSTMMRNIGSVRNRGFEFFVNSQNINRKLIWSTDLNFSFNRNTVLELVNNNQDIFPTSFVNPLNIIRVGEPLGSFWGLIREGVYQNQKEINEHLANPGRTRPGDLKYRDLNNDGIIDSKDRTILGNNNPDFIYGMTNNFSYGQWDLSVQIYGVQGMTVMNLNPVVLEDRQTQTNSYKTLLNRWHGEGTSNTVAAVRINSSLNISNRHAEDGSYLRLRNISLGYRIPKKVLHRTGIGDAALSASLVNWFTFTKYSGYDPEVSTYGGHINQGTEFSSYPASKSLVVNLRINF